jgi:hydrogenase assembly chaperone HypC/HupF
VLNSSPSRTDLPGQDWHKAVWSCPTCKDEGIPGRILSLENGNLATVWLNGGISEVALDLLDGPQVGDFVLVHLGVAIATLNPQDVVDDQPP